MDKNNNSNKNRVSDIAKRFNCDAQVVIDKLRKLNIKVMSSASMLTDEQVVAIEKEMTRKTNKSSGQNSGGNQTSKNMTTGSGVVRTKRVVVVADDSDNNEKNSSNKGKSAEASSDLRAGYVVKRPAKDGVSESKPEPTNGAVVKRSAPVQKAEKTEDSQPKVTRVKKSVPAKDSGAEQKTPVETTVEPESGEKIQKSVTKATPKKESETEVTAEKTKEPEKEPKNETVAETKKASSFTRSPSANENVEIDVGGNAPVKERAPQQRNDRPQRDGNQGRPQGDRNGQSGQRFNQGDRNGQGGQRFNQGDRNGQGGQRFNQGDRQGRPQGDRNSQGGQRFAQGDRNGQQGGFRNDRNGNFDRRPRNDGFNKDGYDKDAYDKDSRPQQRSNSPKPKMTIPGVDPALQMQENRRAERVPEKPKKERKETTSRPTNAPQKDKYKSAKKFIGESKGVDEVFSDDFTYSGAYEVDGSGKKNNRGKKDKNAKNQRPAANPVVIATLTHIKLPPVMTVKEFAELIKKTSADVIKKLMLMGVMATLNQEIDYDTAALIAEEFGITSEPEIIVTDEEILFHDDDDEGEDADAVERPPVVVVMGHVDHGKTSLLDAIRSTSVTTGEAGGITQHIGAYMVRLKGRKITFLDTPGHEAFTAMRARGAQVTDVAIIVVAADDGVMPQTIEAINHAKAANVSIVVAVNKIDKEGANPERVKQEMAEHGLVAEEWGGDIPFIPVSAKKGQNIETLLETVLLSADILELKSNPKKQVKGTVIEAKLDKNRGPVATLLVQRGTLRPGDAVISESTFGHIRTMTDDKGNPIKEAGPSTPVEVTGLPEVPEAGKVFYVVNDDEKRAKRVAETRKNAERAAAIGSNAKISLDELFTQIQAGKVKDLNVIVKADVRGSVEAVKQSLEKLSNEEVRVKTIHGGVGGVTESDILLAEASNAIIIGFNVRPIGNVAEMASSKGVDVRLYRVIYDAINDIQDAMNGMLEPEFKEVLQGHAEIRKTFKVSGVGTIAGAYVTNGKIVRNSGVRIVRDGIVIHEGKLASLKRFKDDAKEVAQGFECGLSFERYDDLKEGDTVECFLMEEIKRNG